MKYWQREIGSWRKKTAELSFEEQGAYAAALDAYYANQGPLPNNRNALYKMTGAFTKADQRAMDRVIDNHQFFHENGGNLHNERADLEIKKYLVFCEEQSRRRKGIKK